MHPLIENPKAGADKECQNIVIKKGLPSLESENRQCRYSVVPFKQVGGNKGVGWEKMQKLIKELD